MWQRASPTARRGAWLSAAVPLKGRLIVRAERLGVHSDDLRRRGVDHVRRKLRCVHGRNMLLRAYMQVSSVCRPRSVGAN